MEAISLETTDEKFLITIDKGSLDAEFVRRLIERLRIEYLAEKVGFDEEIEIIGEDIKSEWWKNNKARMLGIS
jgi:hypothetical protein